MRREGHEEVSGAVWMSDLFPNGIPEAARMHDADCELGSYYTLPLSPLLCLRLPLSRVGAGEALLAIWQE